MTMVSWLRSLWRNVVHRDAVTWDLDDEIRRGTQVRSHAESTREARIAHSSCQRLLQNVVIVRNVPTGRFGSSWRMTCLKAATLRSTLREGRILESGRWDLCTLFDVNYRPEGMSPEHLKEGMCCLTDRVYSDECTPYRRQGFFAQMRHHRTHAHDLVGTC